jgi:hypothetical protein
MGYKYMMIDSYLSRGMINEFNSNDTLDINRMFTDLYYTFRTSYEDTDCRDTLINKYFNKFTRFSYQFINGYSNLQCKTYLSIKNCTPSIELFEKVKSICRLPSLEMGVKNSYNYTKFTFTEFPFPAQVSLFIFLITRDDILTDYTTMGILSNEIIENRQRLFSREDGQYDLAFWTAFACYNNQYLVDHTIKFQQFRDGGNIAYIFSKAFHNWPSWMKTNLKDFIYSNRIEIPESAYCDYDPHNSFKDYLNYFLGGI